MTIVTQNVDGLHAAAGSRNVLELHGTILDARCTDCDRRVPAPDEPVPPLPRVWLVRRALRPDVVWFEERAGTSHTGGAGSARRARERGGRSHCTREERWSSRRPGFRPRRAGRATFSVSDRHAGREPLHARESEVPLARPRPRAALEAPRINAIFPRDRARKLGRRGGPRGGYPPQPPPRKPSEVFRRDTGTRGRNKRTPGQELGKRSRSRVTRSAESPARTRRRSREGAEKLPGPRRGSSRPGPQGAPRHSDAAPYGGVRGERPGGRVPEGMPGASVLDVEVTAISTRRRESPSPSASSASRASRAAPRAEGYGAARRGDCASDISTDSTRPATSVFTRVMPPGDERTTVHAASGPGSVTSGSMERTAGAVLPGPPPSRLSPWVRRSPVGPWKKCGFPRRVHRPLLPDQEA